jgi:hypothetical protein
MAHRLLSDRGKHGRPRIIQRTIVQVEQTPGQVAQTDEAAKQGDADIPDFTRCFSRSRCELGSRSLANSIAAIHLLELAGQLSVELHALCEELQEDLDHLYIGNKGLIEQ